MLEAYKLAPALLTHLVRTRYNDWTCLSDGCSIYNISNFPPGSAHYSRCVFVCSVNYLQRKRSQIKCETTGASLLVFDSVERQTGEETEKPRLAFHMFPKSSVSARTPSAFPSAPLSQQ